MIQENALPATPMHGFVQRPLTAPQLFARYKPQGDRTCFYCSGRCDDMYNTKDVVKPTFTALDTVLMSQFVCQGCVEAMQQDAAIVLACGERRTGQKVQGYSWIITATDRIACTKAHRVQLLEACINPPATPFVVCISDSGQKHLLYRAVVNNSRETITVTLEAEAITYQPQELIKRLELCKQIAAATGKPAMKEQMSVQTQMRIIEHYESDHVLAAWLDCFYEPLTRLAVWLCPSKEECESEYPAVTQSNAKPKHRAVAATPSLFD